MSDTAVATIVTGLITVTTMVVGLLTLWIKLKYGVDEAKKAAGEAQTAVRVAETAVRNVESKIDYNTAITTEYGQAAAEITRHVNNCTVADQELVSILKSYGDRITKTETLIDTLEKQMAIVQTAATTVSKDITSTRHEVRGHLQTIMNKLDVLHLAGITLPKEINVNNKSDADDRNSVEPK